MSDLLNVEVTFSVANCFDYRYFPNNIDKPDQKKLIASVYQIGVQNPVWISARDDGTFRLIAGKGRVKSARIAALQRRSEGNEKAAEKIEMVKVLFFQGLDEDDERVLPLLENVMHQGNDIEAGLLILELIEDMNLEVGSAGFSAVADKLNIDVGKVKALASVYTNIEPELLVYVRQGLIKPNAVKVLSTLPPSKQRNEAVREIQAKGTIKEADAIKLRQATVTENRTVLAAPKRNWEDIMANARMQTRTQAMECLSSLETCLRDVPLTEAQEAEIFAKVNELAGLLGTLGV